MRKIYTKEQIAWLRENAPGHYCEDVVVMFRDKFPDENITNSKMRSLLTNHNIQLGVKGQKLRWTNEKLDFLREFIPGHSEEEIKHELLVRFNEIVTRGIIGNLKAKLGVKSGTVGGQFVKGQKSWNKGKKWADFMSKKGQNNSRKTCFKKGNIPANSKKIGYQRVDVDGFVYVKVQDLHKNRNFKQKHYLVWEAHNGPVPKGYKLRFLDGNRQNCDINNLALVSNSEHLKLSQMERVVNPKLHKSQILVAKLLCKANKKATKKEKSL